MNKDFDNSNNDNLEKNKNIIFDENIKKVPLSL